MTEDLALCRRPDPSDPARACARDGSEAHEPADCVHVPVEYLPAVTADGSLNLSAEIEPTIAGTFALYTDSSGGLVLVTETAEYGVQRQAIPAPMLKLALSSVGGMSSAKAKLAAIFGR